MRKLPPTAHVPSAAFLDSRLSPRDLRVLGVLCALYPRAEAFSLHRHTICLILGLHETQVSKATASLARTGWLRKLGKGGRSSACGYEIQWENLPLNGAKSGTVFDPLNGATFGTVFEQGNDASSGTVYGNGAKSGTVSTETVPKTARFSGSGGGSTRARVARISNYLNISKYISISTDTDSDWNVGSTRVCCLTHFGIVAILREHGMPDSWGSSPQDKKTVQQWLLAGLSHTECVAACERAVSKKADGKPIGVTYVDRVLKTIRNEQGRKRASSENFGEQGYDTDWPAARTA